VNYYVKWKPGRAACADKRIKGANRWFCDALYSDRPHRCAVNRFLVRILAKWMRFEVSGVHCIRHCLWCKKPVFERCVCLCIIVNNVDSA
jgi:hypothetical protein